jgi:hypothetical protein
MFEQPISFLPVTAIKAPKDLMRFNTMFTPRYPLKEKMKALP